MYKITGVAAGLCLATVVDVHAADVKLRNDIAPDWPQPTGLGCYRIIIEGSPSMTCDLQLVGEDGDENTAGLVATAMRVLNAVPAVCAAPPGVLSTLDLPLVTARHLLR